MLRLLGYMLSNGVVTSTDYYADLAEGLGLPKFTDKSCADNCVKCADACPTGAISISSRDEEGSVKLDLGACIGCSVCVRECPQGVLANSKSTRVSALKREDLVVSSGKENAAIEKIRGKSIFTRSIACRVVSTGCSACDLEIAACGNSIFDMERFGVHVVASPRFADVLLVTGPVPKAMHEALRSCYDAMAEPRRVIAVGTCAISGGVHKHGYAEANGVGNILPVDAYIPGCPPHPWSIIDGIKRVMDGEKR